MLLIVVAQQASPLQTLRGEVCEVSQSRVHSGVQCVLPLLQQALAAVAVRPARRPRQFAHQAGGNSEAVALRSAGTDRRRPRSQSPAKQALPSRGKHQTHSAKKVGVVQAKTTRGGSLSQP